MVLLPRDKVGTTGSTMLPMLIPEDTGSMNSSSKLLQYLPRDGKGEKSGSLFLFIGGQSNSTLSFRAIAGVHGVLQPLLTYFPANNLSLFFHLCKMDRGLIGTDRGLIGTGGGRLISNLPTGKSGLLPVLGSVRFGFFPAKGTLGGVSSLF